MRAESGRRAEAERANHSSAISGFGESCARRPRASGRRRWFASRARVSWRSQSVPDTIRVVFREPADPERLRRPDAYSTEAGLKILSLSTDTDDRAGVPAGRAVTLTTEPMNGDAMILDRVQVHESGRTGSPATTRSRPFLQGIVSLPAVQWPREESFPFRSRFDGTIASGSCQKDGGVNSNHLIDQLGFCFIHVEKGGPFNSLKVVGRKHVPGIEKEVQRLRPQRLSPHVLWSGGDPDRRWGDAAGRHRLHGRVDPAGHAQAFSAAVSDQDRGHHRRRGAELAREVSARSHRAF